jgi:hypothetical protein
MLHSAESTFLGGARGRLHRPEELFLVGSLAKPASPPESIISQTSKRQAGSAKKKGRETMDENSIADYITTTFASVETMATMGYTFFFYGSDRMLPFTTIATTDNQGDTASNLDRPGVFRLNIGVSKPTFQSLFGTGKVDVGSYDFTALDTIMPHPDYAAQSWICVLSPSDTTFQRLRPMLNEAYELAVKRASRRKTS